MKGKVSTKDDSCTKFYNGKKPLYLKTDASHAELGAGLPHVRDGIVFSR